MQGGHIIQMIWCPVIGYISFYFGKVKPLLNKHHFKLEFYEYSFPHAQELAHSNRALLNYMNFLQLKILPNRCIHKPPNPVAINL